MGWVFVPGLPDLNSDSISRSEIPTVPSNEGPVPHERPSRGTPSLTGWTRRRLNPLFVTWLMNFPIGWVDLHPLE